MAAPAQAVKLAKQKAIQAPASKSAPASEAKASYNETVSILIHITDTISLAKTLTGHSNSVYSVAFSPDGKTLASGSGDKSVILWNVATGTKLTTLTGHSNTVNSVAFSHDGKTLASGSGDKSVILWNVATGTKLTTLTGHSSFVNSVAFSPDGKTLASGSLDNSVMLWDVETGTKLKTLTGHSSFVNSVAFSPDGKTLASASWDNSVILWNVATGTKLTTLTDHSNSVYSAAFAFSPDGKTLASGSGDKSVILWNVATGTKLTTLTGHSNTVNSVAFSPDGKTLASGSGDKSVILWDAAWLSIFLKQEADVSAIKAERDSKISMLYASKGEFETTKEYESRVADAKEEETRIKKEYAGRIKEVEDKAQKEFEDEKIKFEEKKAQLFPYTTEVSLIKYDADKGGFDAEIKENKVFIPMSREMAMEANKHKDKVIVKGSLKYYNEENAELVNARFVDAVTNNEVAFGLQTEGTMVASAGTGKVTAPPSLAIQSISFTEPSGNKMLDAEEKGAITAVIKNFGKASAYGVNLVLSSDSLLAGVSFKAMTHLGEIKAGEEKTVTAEISATDAIPSSEIKIKAKLTEANGFDSTPFTIAFKTKELQQPLLQIVKVEIQDEEGKRVIKKGNEASITITVQNAGQGKARGMSAIIELGDKDIKLYSDKSVALGALAPGESKKVSFSIAVTQRYSGAKTLPLAFKIQEERNRFSIEPEVKLALNEDAPDMKVVRVAGIESPVVKAAQSEGVEDIPIFAEGARPFGKDDVAVVIGIEQYKDVPKSDYSYADAKLMKAYLRSMGFPERNIEFLHDDRATFSGIKKTIETWLPNRVKQDSRVFVYYSGHGAPEPKTGDAYIVPFDGDPNYLPDTAYPIKTLYEKLGKLQAAEVIVLLDSCFSGSGNRSVLAKGARPLVMMADVAALSPNMVILTATSGAQISTSSPEKGHGVFTYYFLKALKDGKGTVGDVYEYIKPMVEDEAKLLNVQQSPGIRPELSSIKGRFGLRK